MNPVQYWGIKPIWTFRFGTIFRNQPINFILRVEGWDWKFRVENINPVQCWWIISHAQVFLMVYRDHNQVELKAILYDHTRAHDVRLFMVWAIANIYFSNEELEIFDELQDCCKDLGICSLQCKGLFWDFFYYFLISFNAPNFIFKTYLKLGYRWWISVVYFLLGDEV
jgi:hypothetical protein